MREHDRARERPRGCRRRTWPDLCGGGGGGGGARGSEGSGRGRGLAAKIFVVVAQLCVETQRPRRFRSLTHSPRRGVVRHATRATPYILDVKPTAHPQTCGGACKGPILQVRDARTKRPDSTFPTPPLSSPPPNLASPHRANARLGSALDAEAEHPMAGTTFWRHLSCMTVRQARPRVSLERYPRPLTFRVANEPQVENVTEAYNSLADVPGMTLPEMAAAFDRAVHDAHAIVEAKRREKLAEQGGSRRAKVREETPRGDCKGGASRRRRSGEGSHVARECASPARACPRRRTEEAREEGTREASEEGRRRRRRHRRRRSPRRRSRES